MKGELSIRFLLAALTIVGWGTMIWMPFGTASRQESPSYTVQTTLSNAGPHMVEQEITAPLEAALSAIPGVRDVRSTSSAGLSEIRFALTAEEPSEMLIRRVRAMIRTVVQSLPAEAGYPEFRPQGTQPRSPSLEYLVSSGLPDDSLKAWLEPAMALVNDRLQGAIREVRFPNARQPMLLIEVDPDRAADAGFSAAAVLALLRERTGRQPLPVHPDQGMPVVWAGMKSVPQQAARIPLTLDGPASPRLGDLATIRSVCLPAAIRRVNGRPTFTMQILFSHEAGNVQTVARLGEELQKLEQLSGKMVAFDLLTDQVSSLSRQRNQVLLQCGGSAFLLALLLIWLYSWRHVSFLLLSLAATTGITLLCLFLLKRNMSLEVLGGLTLGLGLVVDNSMMLMSMSPGSSRAARMTPLTGATLSTMIPLLLAVLFQPEGMAMLGGFAETLLLMLGGGLLINWVTLPLITGLDYRQSGDDSPVGGWLPATIRWQRKLRWILLPGLILFIGIPLPDLPERLSEEHPLASVYDHTIGAGDFLPVWQPRIQRVLGGIIRPFLQKTEQQPRQPSSGEHIQVSLTGTLPEGTPVHMAGEVATGLEAAILSLDFQPHLLDVEYGPDPSVSVKATFLPEQEAAHWPEKLQVFLRQQVGHYSGIEWSLQGVGEGWSNWKIEQAGYLLTFHGYHADQLQEIVKEAHDSLKIIRGIVKLAIDQGMEGTGIGAMLRLSPGSVTGAGLRPWQWGQEVAMADRLLSAQGVLPAGAGWIPFCVREAGFDRQSVAEWLMKPPRQPGAISARGAWLKPTAGLPVPAIRKEDQQYFMTLSWSFTGSRKVGDRVYDQITADLERRLPAGFTVEAPDKNLSWDASLLSGLLWMLPVLVLIYVLCAAIMESWRLPWLVLLTIPMGYVGPMAVVVWMEIPFGEGMVSGLFLLTGLMVNHAIFLLMSVRVCRRLTADRLAAMIRQKSGAMLLTAASTCLTFGPFLIWTGVDGFWYQLSAGMISGVLSGTALFFLVVPSMLRIRQG